LHALLVARPNGELEKMVSELRNYKIDSSFAVNSRAALQNADDKTPDVVLLSIDRSPEIEALCQYLKSKKVPIIDLLPEENLTRLNPCSDDFVLRPYRTIEIYERIKRLVLKKVSQVSGDQIKAGNLIIDTAKYEVYRNGITVELTFKEYELLKFLASNPGRVFTRDALLNQVWGDDYFGGDRTVDVHIRRLRGKIEDDDQTYIDTVRNIGYRFKK
jgi:DNA-binding response OmpR family regulator